MKILLPFIFVLLILNSCNNDSTLVSSTITTKIKGVSEPSIELNGTWKVNIDPEDNFWKLSTLSSDWKDIQVPGEVMMQGFPIKHDQPFVYKKEFLIPVDFTNKLILLQFEGVYSYARVWINGNYVCDHSGGFTRWDCDITQFVIPGKKAMLTVEVTDKADEISYASGYAKHQIGGILRDVRLLALPENYPVDITIITDLDEQYQNVSLHISGKLRKLSDNAKISFELFDSTMKRVRIKNNSIQLINKKDFHVIKNINNPDKWDAEHPDLYNILISFSENDKIVWEKIYKIGFREVSIEGNKLLVNGSEVKLRGACRHDIHPLLGRVSTPDYELKDVMLAKEANMNFIRTSHYPPSENFLQLCDQYGIYVEDETAVCFVGSHRTKVYYPGASESDTSYSKRYLSQLKEMVNNHKNHPSVIIWSIGNENTFGTNFKESYDWVKGTDNTRPVIFSYPGNVPDSIKSYDILSMHYPGLTGNMTQHGKTTEDFGFEKMPVIYDEWAHVACYNNLTVKEDPNIRDFWGISLDSMWQKTFKSDGGLGGAIWGMIDETFMLPDSLPGYNDWWGLIDEHVIPAEYSGNNVGYGEWGIVDVWRRKKPEFWNTKKAYSPFKILKTSIDNYIPGSSIKVPAYNRFDHTNFNELIIRCKYIDTEFILKPTDILPHTFGIINIPIDNWVESESVELKIYSDEERLVDAYILQQIPQIDNSIKNSKEGAITVEETDTHIVVKCENNTNIHINKSDGLIDEIQKSDRKTSISGPYLNLRTKGKPVIYSYHEINDYSKDWKLDNYSIAEKENLVEIALNGSYATDVIVSFIMTITPNGEIGVKYYIEGVPHEYTRELGIMFEFYDKIDSLRWKRLPYWSYYPEDHLSSAEGNISLYSNYSKEYRIEPKKNWPLDTKSFYYDGTEQEKIHKQLTNIARSTKENITEYKLSNNGKKILSVTGDGDVNCRLAHYGEILQLYISNEIDYIDLSWGNFQRNILIDQEYNNKIVIEIN